MVEQRLAAGVALALSQTQARHVGTVLRLEAGDGVRVFNARDGEWRARIVAKSKRGMSATVEEFLRPARAGPDLELLFAPVKRHATDLIVEKATELGVARIRPVITQRTIAESVRLDRLNAIAREAAEQTERFDAPEVCAPLTLARALDGWEQSRTLIYCDEGGEAPGILAVLTPFPRWEGAGAEMLAVEDEPLALRFTPAPSPSRAGGLAVLIGPEGGFTSQERAMLRALSFVTPVSLGPRILRAETAVISALTIVQAAWGDWRDDGAA